MQAWMIVPKGEGDIAARVKANRSTVIEVTLFLEPGKAHQAFGMMSASSRQTAEVVQVAVTVVENPNSPS